MRLLADLLTWSKRGLRWPRANGECHWDPQRPLATIKMAEVAKPPPVVVPIPSGAPNPQQFEGLHVAAVTRHRRLIFLEPQLLDGRWANQVRT